MKVVNIAQVGVATVHATARRTKMADNTMTRDVEDILKDWGLPTLIEVFQGKR